MNWEEINKLFLLPDTPLERKVYAQRFAKTEPYKTIYSFSEQFNRFHLVFKHNCADLLQEIDRFRNGTGRIGNRFFSVLEIYADSDLQYKHALTATQLLVNFLSSVHFTKDVTRVLVEKRIADPAFVEEYKHEIQERFANNTGVGLLHAMSNFQHMALPQFGAYINCKIDDQGQLSLQKADIMLNKEDLLTGDWNKDQLRRIEDLSDQDGYIAIRDIVAEYCKLQEDFTIWLMTRLYELYAKEIEEMNDVLRGMRGG